jgi:hypothetical protein
MAAMILVLAGLVVWLEVDAMRRLHQSAFVDAQAEYEAPPGASVEHVLAHTVGALTVLLDLRACWFESFPFDALLPRIEEGRILLPAAEPGVAPCGGLGIELPVRSNGLTLGRFVLVARVPSVGVSFPPTARERAIAQATQAGAHIAAALIKDDASPGGSEDHATGTERGYPGLSVE